VPGRGVAISHLLPLGEAREAVERLHRVVFARAEEPTAPASPDRGETAAREEATPTAAVSADRAAAAPRERVVA